MRKIRIARGRRWLSRAIIGISAAFLLLCGVYDRAIPDVISVTCAADLGEGIGLPFVELSCADIAALAHAEGESPVRSADAQATVLGLPLKTVSVKLCDRIRLVPGGYPFGVRLSTDGVLVVGLSDSDGTRPAYDAGLRLGDLLMALNGSPIGSAEELTAAIGGCEGKKLSLTVERQGVSEPLTVELTPRWSEQDNAYKAGIWVRDSTAGIGTVTYVDPESGCFGGLGHGICDVDTGVLMPLRSGSVCDVTLSGIQAGKPGVPGELQGAFGRARAGVLLKNTQVGVFGIFSDAPQANAGEALPIALRGEVREGEATLYATDGGDGVAQYTVRISSIDRSGQDSKNFVVEVTDPALLALTGGIVQGMSGSPLIQNGHLIGAVTHVLINDPTRGYGIFIENMLAQTPQLSA